MVGSLAVAFTVAATLIPCHARTFGSGSQLCGRPRPAAFIPTGFLGGHQRMICDGPNQPDGSRLVGPSSPSADQLDTFTIRITNLQFASGTERNTSSRSVRVSGSGGIRNAAKLQVRLRFLGPVAAPELSVAAGSISPVLQTGGLNGRS